MKLSPVRLSPISTKENKRREISLAQRFLAIWALVGSMNAFATSLPPPPPPSLEYKIQESDRVVVAKIGIVKFVKLPNTSDLAGRWEMSDTPLPGYSQYMNLTSIKVLHKKPAQNENQLRSESLDLPQWVGAACFGFKDNKHTLRPAGETWVFFLSRKILQSKAEIHSSQCTFDALPLSEQSTIEDAIQKNGTKAK